MNNGTRLISFRGVTRCGADARREDVGSRVRSLLNIIIGLATGMILPPVVRPCPRDASREESRPGDRFAGGFPVADRRRHPPSIARAGTPGAVPRVESSACGG